MDKMKCSRGNGSKIQVVRNRNSIIAQIVNILNDLGGGMKVLEAWQAGYYDALCDGVDTAYNHTGVCRWAYYAGQRAGMRRLMALMRRARIRRWTSWTRGQGYPVRDFGGER